MNPGYPLGWIRHLSVGYDNAETFQFLAQSVRACEFGSEEYHRALMEMGRLPFSEQDKAWYRPSGGI